MKPRTKVLMVVAFLFLAPASLPAAPATFELSIYQEGFVKLGFPYKAEEAEPALRKLRQRQPLFTLHAGDIESYVWQTQRITFTREATARLCAAIECGHDLFDHAFLVKLDGAVLYGGLVLDPGSALGCDFPVIHPEVVDGRAIFYLLPVHRVHPFPRIEEFEESVGSSGWFVRSYRKDPDPFTPQGWESPELMRFRKTLRDPRVRDLFEKLGKLIPAPLPPRTPEEIRTALLQTDREVDVAYANGSAVYAGEILADGYRRVSAPGRETDGKADLLDALRSGAWKFPFYAVLAREEPVLTGERGAVRRVLVALRGKRYGNDVQAVEIATRRYEFNGERWLLKDEAVESCAEDAAGPWQHATPEVNRWALDPCWPPAGPPR